MIRARKQIKNRKFLFCNSLTSLLILQLDFGNSNNASRLIPTRTKRIYCTQSLLSNSGIWTKAPQGTNHLADNWLRSDVASNRQNLMFKTQSGFLFASQPTGALTSMPYQRSDSGCCISEVLTAFSQTFGIIFAILKLITLRWLSQESVGITLRG